jgi:hypothetical protein
LSDILVSPSLRQAQGAAVDESKGGDHLPTPEENQPRTRQQQKMILKIFSAGFAGIAAWWLENRMPISAEDASQRVTRDLLPDYLRLMIRS